MIPFIEMIYEGVIEKQMIGRQCWLKAHVSLAVWIAEEERDIGGSGKQARTAHTHVRAEQQNLRTQKCQKITKFKNIVKKCQKITICQRKATLRKNSQKYL